MDYTAGFAGMVCGQNVISILRGVSGMNDHWLFERFCKFKLAHKPFLLNCRVWLVPIVIQTNLPDCHHLLMCALRREPFKLRFVERRALARVHPCCRIYIRILFCELYAGLCAFQACTYIDQTPDHILLHGGKEGLSVLIKCLVIIVGMCLKYHEFIPFLCSCSPTSGWFSKI